MAQRLEGNFAHALAQGGRYSVHRDGRKMRVPREEQGKGAGRKRNPAGFRRSGLEKAHVPLVIKWAVEGEARCGGVEQPPWPSTTICTSQKRLWHS